MVKRSYWIKLIEKEWRHRSIIWLSGVRRVGKTYLCQSLDNVEYFDCELPRIRRELDDPEAFLRRVNGKRVILDEVHRLDNPSELLKIGADHYPKTKIVATGSSTLQASSKFSDTLTGRKREIWLSPMIDVDLTDFGNDDLKHRLLFGGLPPFFLSKEIPERDFQEWIDSYWSKDVQMLFRLEKHASFAKFVELIFAGSGGIFEATKYAAPCEISRTTVRNYLSVLEKTWVAHAIKPFSSRRQSEIVAAPKVYAFDTGFVCYFRGWFQLRNEDLGQLWEHYVLNEIQSRYLAPDIRYWRTKTGHEVDFVLSRRGQPPTAIECKWSAKNIDFKNIRAFRRFYPGGKNFIVCADVDRPFSRLVERTEIEIVGLPGLIDKLAVNF